VLAASGAIDSGLLGGLGVICLVILTITLWRRSQQRRATARDLTREQRARLRDQEQLRQAMEELLAQLEETATRVDTQIAARTTKLEELLRQADERVLGTTAGGTAVPAGGTAVLAGGTAVLAGGTAVPAGGTAVPAGGTAVPAVKPHGDQRQRVCELADQGKTPIAIAEALHMPIGEVELILNVRHLSSVGPPWPT
jgi:hypothetical protein